MLKIIRNIYGLPLYTEKPGIWQFRQKIKLEKSGIQEILKKTWKILEFLTIFISYVVKFRFKINTLSN